jgi:beta-lactamase class A
MLRKKIPLYFLLIVISFFSLAFCFSVRYIKTQNQSVVDDSIAQPGVNDCNVNVKRLKGFEFVKPLLFAEPACESAELNNCKSSIESLIGEIKGNGDADEVSVYLRVFGYPQWMSINESVLYSPGSLLKVPEMIAFYKLNEEKPGFLDKKITYTAPIQNDRSTTFNSKHIEIGKTYTIRDLLFYMIVYSDNQATLLLNNELDKNFFNKIFTDIGLSVPDYSKGDYPMNVKDYSLFFIELFNASYLNFNDSEACLSLLSKSDFKDGLLSGIPEKCPTAHKFGEGGASSLPNFSESGIIYNDKHPYLLTIMMKGKDMKKLPGVSAKISKKVYEMVSQLQ